MGLQLLMDRVREARRVNAEQRLEGLLGSRRLEGRCFRHHAAVGPFVVDFVCLEQALVVELMADQHALGLPTDARRKIFLESLGFRVLRVWDSEVLSDPGTVLKKVAEAL